MINDIAAPEAPGLDEYLRMLWRRKLIIALCLVAGVVLASLYAGSITPMYSAQARVVLGPLPGPAGQLQEANLEKEADNVQSDAITRRVIEQNKLDTSVREAQKNLKVEFTPDSDVLRLNYTDTDPKRAAAVANAFANIYVDGREAVATAYYKDSLDQKTAELNQIDANVKQKQLELSQIGTAITALSRIVNPSNEVLSQLDNLRTDQATKNAEVQILAAQRGAIASEISDITRESRIRAKAADVTRSAREPSGPNGLSKNMIKALGVVGGLLLGAIAAFVLDRFDTTTRDEREVETVLGAPVLASIPAFPAGSANGLIMLRSTTGKKTASARDSYRRLRSTLDFMAKRNDLKTFLVTSSRPGEGKSVTATNLAVAEAQTGKRVALVSCDLHRPTIERMLSLPEHAGVAEFLLDESEAILSTVDDVPNLTVVTTGRLVENPAELLAGGRVAELIKHLEENNDIVLLDTPPVLNAADALALASRVDGVIVVADSRATETEDLEKLRDEMELVGANVVGSVLNRRRLTRKRESYGYSYTSRRVAG